jgi:hypothetical protein
VEAARLQVVGFGAAVRVAALVLVVALTALAVLSMLGVLAERETQIEPDGVADYVTFSPCARAQ